MSPWTRKTGILQAANSVHCHANDQGDSYSPLFSYRLRLYKWTTWTEGKNFFWVISESLSDFFSFCSVNPNLRDLKPTFPFKTESLFVFFFFFGWRGGKKNEIPQRYFLPFCTRKLPSLGGSQFVSNFSHLPPLRQVSWEKASPVQTMVLTGRLLGVVGPGLPLRVVCKWSWTWEIGGQCQVSLVLFQVLWNQIESATKAAPRGLGGGGGLCT